MELWLMSSLALYCCLFALGHAQTTVISAASVAPSRKACPTELPSPVVIPIQNVTKNRNVLRRALPIQYGTPPQQLAMEVTLYEWRRKDFDWIISLSVLRDEDNTYINDQDAECGPDDTVDQCETRLGGLFDGSRSGTFRSSIGLSAPGFVPLEGDGNPRKVDESATDTIYLNGSTALKDFPVGINRAFHLLGLSNSFIGLNTNSTAMKALIASGRIFSNTVGMYYGWDGTIPSTSIDGSLVLGGYDRAKVDGARYGINPAYSINPAPGCLNGLQLRIDDITVDFSNGTSGSILENMRATKRGCINTYQEGIGITPKLWDKFQALTRSEESGRIEDGFNNRGFSVSAEGAFTGNLTITIEGPSSSSSSSSPASTTRITIPNHQLITPIYSADGQGERYINDTENVKIRMWTEIDSTDENGMLVLGKAFLASTYLLADHDNNSFTLWPATPTNNTDIVPILSDKVCDNSSLTNSNNTNSNNNDTASAATTPPTERDNDNESPSAGVIAGSVIGSLAALSFLLTLLFLLLRRRASQQRLAQRDAATTEANKAWWAWRLWRLHEPPQSELDGSHLKSELGGSSSSEYSPGAAEMGPPSATAGKVEADGDGERVRRELDGGIEGEGEKGQRMVGGGELGAGEWVHEMEGAGPGSGPTAKELQGGREGLGTMKELPGLPDRRER